MLTQSVSIVIEAFSDTQNMVHLAYSIKQNIEHSRLAYKKATVCDCGLFWVSSLLFPETKLRLSTNNSVIQGVTITKTYLYNFDPLNPHFYIV